LRWITWAGDLATGFFRISNVYRGGVMKKLIRLIVGLVVPALVIAGGMASSAVAQDKAEKGSTIIKGLLDNAKVRVFELTLKPGEEQATPVTSASRVVRVLKGGTIERTFSDGKKEKLTRKTGEVYMLDPGPTYTFKNTGKGVFQIYVVQLK
jgi:hypothetical protein